MDPLVNNVMNAPDDKLLTISEVFDYELEEHPHSFNSFVCEDCGEMTEMEYGRVSMKKGFVWPVQQHHDPGNNPLQPERFINFQCYSGFMDTVVCRPDHIIPPTCGP